MENLLEVKNLTFSFHTYGGVVKAVRDVSFEVRPGEILGIVGESGCGKSVTSSCIMRLNPEPPGFFEGGEILYKGDDVLKMDKKALRNMRGTEIGFIFQDPMTSLNPTMRIGKQIEEVFVGKKNMSAAEKKQKALDILKMVGISDGERRYKQYPHELSGGMKQRVMIAIALVGSPSIVIADEPTTALDVTIQAQILKLMKQLVRERNASLILITHDLAVVSEMVDRIVVMYCGKIVEQGPVEEIIHNPGHPYTEGLLASIPRLRKEQNRLDFIPGMVPNMYDLPKGCLFAPRCKYCQEVCKNTMPAMEEIGKDHKAACYFTQNLRQSKDCRKEG